jgi:hypothetical protein
MSAKAIGLLAAAVLIAVGVGCNRGQDRQEADGTKIFGERTLKDGTLKQRRVVLPSGIKKFDVSLFPDGIEKIERVELPDGQRAFNFTRLPDRTVKTERIELTNGVKMFDVTISPDGTESARRSIAADGREIPQEPVFGAEQNDSAGFDGIPWGTPASDERFHHEGSYDADSYKTYLGKVVGPPVDWPDDDNVRLYEAASSRIASWQPTLPHGIGMNMKDGVTCYGFYDDKFAFAFQFVGDVGDSDAEAKALAATRSKYPVLKTVAAESWGDPPNQTLSPYLVRFTGDHSGYLFRRGETNTRIYLFRHDLMYIPQFYLSAVRERWKTVYGEAAAAAAKQQREQKEQQKRSIEKAVQ